MRCYRLRSTGNPLLHTGFTTLTIRSYLGYIFVPVRLHAIIRSSYNSSRGADSVISSSCSSSCVDDNMTSYSLWLCNAPLASGHGVVKSCTPAPGCKRCNRNTPLTYLLISLSCSQWEAHFRVVRDMQSSGTLPSRPTTAGARSTSCLSCMDDE